MLSGQGRHICHQGLSLQRLLLSHVGVSAAVQKSRVDQTAGLQKRIGRDFRRVSALQSAGQHRPEVLRHQVRVQRRGRLGEC